MMPFSALPGQPPARPTSIREDTNTAARMITPMHPLALAASAVASAGVGAGAAVDLDLRKLMARRTRVLGSHLRSRPLEEKADAARRVEHQTLPLVADGRLRIPVAATFPLEEAQEAYDRFTTGGKLGKLVLVTGSA